MARTTYTLQSSRPDITGTFDWSWDRKADAVDAAQVMADRWGIQMRVQPSTSKSQPVTVQPTVAVKDALQHAEALLARVQGWNMENASEQRKAEQEMLLATWSKVASGLRALV